MSTKAEIVNAAYDEIRISGLTVNPSPSDLVDGLERLEDMMAEFQMNYNMALGYNFENSPNINSETGVTRNFNPMMKYCLATRLIPMFNKQVPPKLLQLESAAFSGAQGINAAMNMREVQPPRTMPRGSGNTFRGIDTWQRFMVPVNLPPSAGDNKQIEEGETQTYQESFAAWLEGNTIASYTITADPRLTIDTSANADPLITYTVTAGTSTSYGPWQYVKITVTDSAGRVEIRLINFVIGEVPTVPAP